MRKNTPTKYKNSKDKGSKDKSPKQPKTPPSAKRDGGTENEESQMDLMKGDDDTDDDGGGEEATEEGKPSLPEPNKKLKPTADNPYPYAEVPACHLGVIITPPKDYKQQRELTEADKAAAAEEMGFVSEQYTDCKAAIDKLQDEVSRIEQALKDERAHMRHLEKRRVDLADILSTYGNEVRSGKRNFVYKVVETLTPDNQIIGTDAATGDELYRREATPGEIDKAKKKQTEMKMPAGTAPAQKVEKGTGDTTHSDSPTPKGKAGDELMPVSVSKAKWDAALPRLRDNCTTIDMDEKNPYVIDWQDIGTGRIVANIPRRHVGALRTRANGELDLVVGNPFEPKPAENTKTM